MGIGPPQKLLEIFPSPVSHLIGHTRAHVEQREALRKFTLNSVPIFKTNNSKFYERHISFAIRP